MNILSTYLMLNSLASSQSQSITNSSLGRQQIGTYDNSSFLSVLQNVQNNNNQNNAMPYVTSKSNSNQLSAGVSMDAIFDKAAEKYGVSSDLLKAIGKAESGFNANAVSEAGAIGVMQLMPSTARGLGVTDPYDAEQNIMGGAKYISQMLKKYDGDVKLALAAYNAGPGNVDKYNGIPPFKETQNYVEKVIGYMGSDISPTEMPSIALDENSTKNDSSLSVDKETLLSLLTLMRTQMELQMASALSSWDTEDSDSENLLML